MTYSQKNPTEVGGFSRQEEPQEFLVCIACGSDCCVCEPTECINCYGAGFNSHCMDDLCHGEDGCIHGNGNFSCSECDGDGLVYPDKIPEEEYLKRNKEVVNSSHTKVMGILDTIL